MIDPAGETQSYERIRWFAYFISCASWAALGCIVAYGGFTGDHYTTWGFSMHIALCTLWAWAEFFPVLFKFEIYNVAIHYMLWLSLCTNISIMIVVHVLLQEADDMFVNAQGEVGTGIVVAVETIQHILPAVTAIGLLLTNKYAQPFAQWFWGEMVISWHRQRPLVSRHTVSTRGRLPVSEEEDGSISKTITVVRAFILFTAPALPVSMYYAINDLKAAYSVDINVTAVVITGIACLVVTELTTALYSRHLFKLSVRKLPTRVLELRAIMSE
jgi:hypothetical protein